MIKILALLLCLLLPGVSQAQIGDEVTKRCHKLEGVRLKGCSPQSKPLECGPPKPCPPCTAAISCGTMIQQESGGGGICIAYGQPTCYDTPDGRHCDPAPCIQYTEPRCNNVTVACYRDSISVPSTGTYDCEVIECRCDAPPPGYVYCPGNIPCQDNNPCTP